MNSALLPRDYIISQAVEKLPGICGVYFLISEGEIVYVGKSTNVPSRVREHKSNYVKFDHIYWIPCEEKNLDELEKMYIEEFMPKLNRSIKGGNATQTRRDDMDALALALGFRSKHDPDRGSHREMETAMLTGWRARHSVSITVGSDCYFPAPATEKEGE